MKGKKKWIIIAVIIVLALIGAVSSGGKDEKPAGSSEPLAAETAEDEGYTAAEEPAGEPAEETAEEPAFGETSETAADGISPELKEFLDSYEAFIDEYCDFMENYNESDPAQLLKYAALMEKYYDFSEKAEAWDEKDMTDEDTLYYVKVMNRVNEKLLETGVALS